MISRKEDSLMSIGRILLALASLTYGQASAAPVIAKGAVLNNASYARDGALNRAIAQGSVFAIFGKGLGPSTLMQVQSFPLTATLGGTSVKISTGGRTIDALPIYVSDGQVGAVLPSSTPLGAGTVTVTFQGETSAPEAITVVRRSFGVFTLNQAGSGPAIVQNFNSESDQPLNSLITPARPGQSVTLWGTGLGPVAADDASGPAPGDLDSGITVYVGGIAANVRYRGRSGCCAGIDQVVFDIPQGVQGCYVPVHVVGRGLLSTRENLTIPVEHTVSNSVTIAVAPQGQNACSDPSGLTAAELLALQKPGALRVGAFTFMRRPAALFEATQDTAAGQFSRFDFAGFLKSRGIFGVPALGSCLQYQVDLNELDSADPIRGTSLDAGSELRVSGPNGERQLTRDASGAYSAFLGGKAVSGGSTPSYLAPGSYTLSNGRGGTDVGAFEAKFSVPAPLTWTNKNPDAFAKSFNPTVEWQGGEARGYVIAAAYGRNDLTGFYTICTQDPAARSFTIPRYVYAGLVMHTSAAPDVLWIGSGAVDRFDAPGLDMGWINTIIGTDAVFIP